MEIPSGVNLGHPVVAIRIIGFSPPGVLESTAANGVDADEDDEHDNVKHRELVPIPSNVFKHTCLARIALVAQHAGVIAP